MLAAYSASLLAGGVSGMMVGDIIGSVSGPANVPATSNSAAPRATANGTPVSKAITPRQSLWLSASYVVAAMAVLIFGSRALRDARIG